MENDPRVQDIQKFIPFLIEMRAMLTKHGRSGQADVLSELIGLAEQRSPGFAKKIVEGDFWGSSGSVIDVSFGYDDEGTREELIRDNATFHRLIISLAEEMRMQGVRHGRAEWVADAFRSGLNEDID